MPNSQKLTEELKLRVSEDLLNSLMRQAAEVDRSLSDYVRWALTLHSFGHDRKVKPADEDR